MASHDYEEFIAALNAHGARYLVVGAHAVAFHARPRATKDLDILIESTAGNARKVLDALRDFFGGADLGYTVEDLTTPDWIIQLAQIILGKTAIEVQPFRNEGMPIGMANCKSQIPDMKFEICDLKFRAPARIQGHTSITIVSSGFLVA